MCTDFNNSFTAAFYNSTAEEGIIIILHLASNLLPHITLQNLNVQLHNFTRYLIIQNCDKWFIYRKYLQKCHILNHMSVQLIYNIKHAFKISWGLITKKS